MVNKKAPTTKMMTVMIVIAGHVFVQQCDEYSLILPLLYPNELQHEPNSGKLLATKKKKK
jgi:hypothetical protein